METEKIKINGKNYKIKYVTSMKFKGFPLLGSFTEKNKTIRIRKYLSPDIKRYVLAHEIYHAKDKRKGDKPLGIIIAEIKATIYAGFKEPVGILKVAFGKNMFKRIKFWSKLFKSYLLK